MKSIKPGRGPSMMGAFGSAAAAVFGVFWTIMAMSIGAPIFFALFGMIFVAIGIVQTVYNYKNATGKNRYSAFEITDDKEEPDPLNAIFGGDRDGKTSVGEPASGAAETTRSEETEQKPANYGAAAFCPYCGSAVEDGYSYCPKCGKKLPL